MIVERAWRFALMIGITVSIVVSGAFCIAMSAAGLKPGILSSLSKLIAMTGFLGYIAGMFSVGNAHAGGPLPLVLAVATVVNAGLYTLIAYAVIRLVEMISKR